jgi:hypothetical protein
MNTKQDWRASVYKFGKVFNYNTNKSFLEIVSVPLRKGLEPIINSKLKLNYSPEGA